LLDATSSPVKPVLLDPCAAALNQNDQDDDKKYAADNLDNRDTAHNNSPFSQLPASCVINPNTMRAAAWPSAQSVLLDPCAATLNQDHQDDNKEHRADNPDHRGTVHIDSSFL